MAHHGTTALGLVVNPKLKQPILVVLSDGHVRIYSDESDGWEKEGEGYYDTDGFENYLRTHTPRGVATEGMGYGTSLYTGLCLGAHQNWDDRLELSRSMDADGVCSFPASRSDEAHRWWDRADRLGLVEHREDQDTEENVDVTSDFDHCVMGESVGEGEVSYVNTIDVDVTRNIDVNIYEYDSAEAHELVLADFTVEVPHGVELAALWRLLKEDRRAVIESVAPELILALDVRGLSLDTMNLLGTLLQHADASDEDQWALRRRWEFGLDPDEPIRQISLPLTANSAEVREALEAVDRARALRAETDWSALAALP